MRVKKSSEFSDELGKFFWYFKLILEEEPIT